MEFNEFCKIIFNIYMDWMQNIEECRTKLTLYEYLANSLLESFDIYVKE